MKPITYWISSDPIENLTASFGQRLQLLPKPHKTFLLKCLSHQLCGVRPMSELIEDLDPNAEIPARICDAITTLDGLPESDLLNLIEAIIAQLRSPC